MESQAIAAHPEDSNKMTCEEIIRATENWFRDQHLCIRCRGWPKKWNQGDAGSWLKLTTAHGQLTRCTVPSGNSIKWQSRRHELCLRSKEPSMRPSEKPLSWRLSS
jgi:hypothetical protein